MNFDPWISCGGLSGLCECHELDDQKRLLFVERVDDDIIIFIFLERY